MRPIVKEQLGEDLDWRYFSQTLVTDYENEHGEEPLAYRDPRGTFYEPHAGEEFPLGTLHVEKYGRAAWRFNKVLYLEKEGFFEALKSDGWPERHDCALMTSKGQPSRAARDLIDLIGETDEPVQVFCLHDADAAGTLIFQSLQEETRARPRRNVEIVNLGLDPWEALELAERGIVEVEIVSYEKAQAVAMYIDEQWRRWLQTHRVELNAFTTPQFIAWLDGKIAPYLGKVVPPTEVLAETLDGKVRGRLRDNITHQILAKARIDEQVKDAYSRLSGRIDHLVTELKERVAGDLEDDPLRHWEEVVGELVESLVHTEPGTV